MFISKGLTLPCYAVIFSSLSTSDDDAFGTMGASIDELVKNEEGFLSMESVYNASGESITVCYWRTLADIKRWKEVALHQEAQRLGKQKWFDEYAVRITEIKESYELNKEDGI
ncbi:MAG TPA: antibiotic biosynthesis monooxygenase [Candidatus Kapabacteria bacterium]|nr:antibiotic biosynthesis monooxygenase [Candidatus Kapabacteria bacterium]